MSNTRFYHRLCRVIVGVLLPMTLLSACQVLPEREPVDLYQLPPASISAASGTAIDGGLRLMTPESSDALNGARLLILNNNNGFQAWAGTRWTAPIPALWRDWLLDAFWRDGRFRALSTDSNVLQSQHSLGGMLRAFHIEHDGRQQVAVIRFDAQLIDSASREIIASQRFEASEPVSGNNASAAVAAMGMAADRLARALIDWAAESHAPSGSDPQNN